MLNKNILSDQRVQFISLSVLFLVLAIVVFLIWLPYLKLVAVGAILAILFAPVYKRVLKMKKFGNNTIAASVTVALILLIVFVPLYLVGQALFNETLTLYHNFKDGNVHLDTGQFISSLPQGLQNGLSSFTRDLGQRISGLAGAAVGGVSGIISNIASFTLSFFLIIFTVFYLLRDGDSIKSYFGTLLPLSENNKDLLVQKISSAVTGVVKGSFLVALIQGVVATIGFFIFGVPNALLWGAFTVFAALVPTIGTALSLIPAILYLFIVGHTGSAIGLIVWATLAVGMIDNIVGPRLVGSTSDLHPLLVLFSILGGVALFGFIGFLLGPICMAVFVAMLSMFRSDLKQHFGTPG